MHPARPPHECRAPSGSVKAPCMKHTGQSDQRTDLLLGLRGILNEQSTCPRQALYTAQVQAGSADQGQACFTTHNFCAVARALAPMIATNERQYPDTFGRQNRPTRPGVKRPEEHSKPKHIKTVRPVVVRRCIAPGGTLDGWLWPS